MALPSLISTNRAQENPQLAPLGNDLLTDLIAAASGLVRDYCQHDFSLTSYSEMKNGGIFIREPLLLRHDPVTQILRVAATPTSALSVANTDTVNNQRATVATDDAGNGLIANLTLFWVSSATPTTVPLPVATYPTLSQMAAAINAQGHGWQASVLTASRIDLTKYPASDLKPLQGAVTCMSGSPAYLSAWLEDISAFGSIANDFYELEGYQSQSGWRLDPETGELYGRFPRGQMNIRVDYTAGYAQIPAAVQEATVQTTLWLWHTNNMNLAMESERLGDAGRTMRQKLDLPGSIKRLLANYNRSASRAFYR